MRKSAALLLVSITLLLLLAAYVAPHSYATQFRETPNARGVAPVPAGDGRAGPRPLLPDALRRPDLAVVRACRGPGFQRDGAPHRAGGRVSRQARRTARRGGGGCLPFAALAVCAARRARRTAAECGAVGRSAGHLRAARPVGLGRAGARHPGRREAPTGLGFHPVRARQRMLPAGASRRSTSCRICCRWPARSSWSRCRRSCWRKPISGCSGLGIPEPIPSLGGLLRELENLPGAVAHPWMFVPALLLFAVVSSFHLLVSADKYSV